MKKAWVGVRLCMALMATLVMCWAVLPTRAFAVVGPVVDRDDGVTIQQVGGVARITNSYITCEVDVSSGTKMRTVPTKYLSGTLADAAKQHVYQELQFTAAFSGSSEKKLNPKQVKVDTSTPGSLVLDYTFDDSSIKASVEFEVFQTTEGIPNGSITFPLTMDSYVSQHGADTHGKTYVVVASARWECDKKGKAYMNVINHRMPFYGHAGESSPRKLVASHGSCSNGTHNASLISLAGGLGKTWSGADHDDPFTEVGTISYDEANPFVLLDARYDSVVSYWDGSIVGVEGLQKIGHPGAAAFSYIPARDNGSAAGEYDVLTAWSDGSTADLGEHEQSHAQQGWGFRNLYAAGEEVVPLTADGLMVDSEFEDITTNAGQLAVVPKGSSTTDYEVKALAAKAAVPQNAVAVFRGTFTYSSGLGYYEFKEGKAYLSPTISANFNPERGGYFRVRTNGQIEYRGIRLSTPASCFYKSRNSGDEPVFAYKDGKLFIGLDPTNNDASVSIDIPYAQTSLESATVDTKGNIVFGGGLKVRTLFDSTRFELARLSYGNDSSGVFAQKGVEAKLEASDLNLFGLGVNKAKGVINTFDSYYNFELAVNAYDVFSFEADLELTKTSDGVLMPNTLYGELVVQGQGIPLVPPAPVAEINGGGIGFSDLVKTLNGDYLAVPPVRVRITAAGKVLKIISGKVTASVGPTGIEISGTDLYVPNDKGMRLIDELKLYFSDEGAKRLYKGKTYNGINVKGGASLKASFIKPKTGQSSAFEDMIKIDGGLELSGFGGTNGNNFYLVVDTTGKIKASIAIPKKVPAIGGTKLSDIETLVSLGATTLVPINSSSSNPFGDAMRSLDGYLGVCATFKVLGFYGRVYYVSPDTFDADVYSSKPDDIDFSSLSTQSASTMGTESMPVYDETGTQIGVAVFDDGLVEQVASITRSASGNNGVIRRASAMSSDDKGLVDEGVVEEVPSVEEEPAADRELLVEDNEDDVSDVDVSLEDEHATEESAIEEDAEEGVSESPNDIQPQSVDDESSLTISLPNGVSVAGKTAVIRIDNLNKNTADKAAFLNGLAVDGQTIGVANEVDASRPEDYLENDDLVGKALLDENDGKITTAYLYLNNTKREWEVSSTTETLTTENTALLTSSEDQYESLENVSLTGSTVSMKATNLKPATNYELHVYFGTDSETVTCGVGEPITIPDDVATHSPDPVVIPTSGELVETGDYYVSVALVEVVDESHDADGNTTESMQLPLARWVSTTTVHYTNTTMPSAPANVTVTPSGNETLTCTFSESDNNNVDGYRIRIYKDGEDTGYGYDYAMVAGENGARELQGFGSNDAMTHDEAAHTYTIRIAPTASIAMTDGGEQSGEEQLPALTPGAGYSIGVSAYRYLAVENGSQAEDQQNYPVYGREKVSSDVTITQYERPDATITVNDRVLTANDEGIYEGILPANRPGFDGRSELKVTITSAGTYALQMLDAESVLVMQAEGATLSGYIPEIDGSVMYSIVITDKDTLDSTTLFLRLSKDDVPPSLLMDADAFAADTDGNYTISGTTDAGTTVSGPKDKDGNVQNVTTGKDGKFELTGSLLSKFAVLERDMISYELINTNEEQLTSEAEFNALVDSNELAVKEGRNSRYAIEPPAWDASVTTYQVTVWIPAEELYADDAYNEYLNNTVMFTNVRKTVKTEVQPYDEQLVEYANEHPETVRLTVDYRLTSFQNLTVQAEDENGNMTKATVSITTHQHNLNSVAQVPATCSKTGTRAHYVCGECHGEFEDAIGTIPAGDLTLPIDPDNHTFGAWTTTKEATVLAEGKQTRTCSGCKKQETRTVAKLKATISLAAGGNAIDNTKVSLKTGQSYATITAKLGSGDGIAKAESSNTAIAKVSFSGTSIQVTAQQTGGTATVTVTTKGGASTKFTVVVTKPTVTLTAGGKTIDNGTMSLKTGQTYSEITAKVGSGDRLASATSSATGILKASVSGSKIKLVAQQKAGTATVTVKTADGATTQFKVSVTKSTVRLVVGTIKVNKTTVPLQTGQSFSKIVAKLDSGNKLTKVSSSKPKIVKASFKGNKIVLKALKKTGKSTITVKTAWGASAKFTVSVQKGKVVAKKIVGFKTSVTLKKGKTYQIPSSVMPVSTPDAMKFKSSKKSVATVSSKGLVKAKGKGKTVITVTIGKKTFKCTVTVK